MQDNFVNLHNHSHFSILDGLMTEEDLVAGAKKLNQTSVALTDHGTISGVIKFYKEANKQNIKPIIGCEFYFVDNVADYKTSRKNKDKVKAQHVVLLAKNDVGYRNLVKLTTYANKHFYYRPLIDWQAMEEYHEGLICMSACIGGLLSYHILNDNINKFKSNVLKLKNLFGDDFYFESQNTGVIKEAPNDLKFDDWPVDIKSYITDEDRFFVQGFVRDILRYYSKEYNVKMVPTNDAHYLEASDGIVHDVMLSINMRKNLGEICHENENYALASRDYMKAVGYTDEEIGVSLEIADKCNVSIELGVAKFPNYNNMTNEEAFEELKRRARKGWKKLDITGKNFMVNGKYTDRIKYVKFVDFSQMRNAALRMATKDYVLMLDADEKLLKDELWCLRELVKRPQCEVWYLARRHYADLEMKTELPNNPPYPDWQCRFLKNLPHIHYIRPVHEIINGTQKRGYSHKPTIRHFHTYFKTKEEQEERQKLYAYIMRQDTKYKY